MSRWVVVRSVLAGASPPSFVWGDGFMGTQANLPQKFSFSSDFGHFISKMLENTKFANVLGKEKDTEI